MGQPLAEPPHPPPATRHRAAGRSCGDGAKGPLLFDWAVASLPCYEDTTPPGWSRHITLAMLLATAMATVRWAAERRRCRGQRLPGPFAPGPYRTLIQPRLNH